MASEEFKALMAAMSQLTAEMLRQQQTMVEFQRAPQHHTRRVETKYVKVDKFGGKLEEFDDWAFQVKRSIRAQDVAAFDLMTHAENELQMDREGLGETDSKLSAEIYDVLCSCVKDAAFTIVRGCDDMAGCMAWHRLHKNTRRKQWPGQFVWSHR